MTTPNAASRHREFSSRRAQVQEQITREFLDYTTQGALADIHTTLNAVQELATDGPADSDTLMKIAEAMMIVTKLADEVTKSCAAEATAIDVTPRDAAKTIRVSPNTLKKWIDTDDHSVEMPDQPWWATTSLESFQDQPEAEVTPEGDTAEDATEDATEEAPDTANDGIVTTYDQPLEGFPNVTPAVNTADHYDQTVRPNTSHFTS